MQSLFQVDVETGAVDSGDCARLLSVPRNPVHWVRAGQGPAVLAVGVGGVVWTIFSLLCRFCPLHCSPGDDYAS